MNVRERVADQGFAFLANFRPKESSQRALARLGTLLGVPEFGEVQTLRPKRPKASTPNTYSGNFGHGVFPLHTDLAHWSRPPRYLALRCLSGSDDVATLVLNGDDLVAKIGPVTMRRALVQPRRPLAGMRVLLRLRECGDDKEPLIRWDALFLRPATPSSRETFQEIEAYLCTAKPTTIVLLKRGDTLLLDNWRMLHGRARVPKIARDRHIERAYLRELR
jgi:L-asparagine oxygenase